MKYYYMAFVPQKEGNYAIFSPDFKELASQGANLQDCMTMAIDALQIVTESYAIQNKNLPEPCGLDEARQKILDLLQNLNVSIPNDIFFQLVPTPTGNMKPVRISATFTRWTLDMIDMKAKLLGMTRSGFLVKAAQAYNE